MKKINNSKMKKIVGLCLVLAMAFLTSCGGGDQAEAELSLEDYGSKAAEFVKEQVPQPYPGTVGGEWTVKGLKDAGMSDDDDYFSVYYDNVRAKAKSTKGVLSERHFTEFARVCIALKSIGKDPADVEGYNLLTPLDNYEGVTYQGVNAAGYVLVASNVCGYKLENEEKYIEFIAQSINDGTYNKGTDEYGNDYIAMGLLGLSFYKDREDVAPVIEKGINAIKEYQKEDGSFGNCESTSECIAAFSQLGIDVTQDERFNVNGKTPLDGLMLYMTKDGGFLHELEDEEESLMASERGLTAINSIILCKKGQPLYQGIL